MASDRVCFELDGKRYCFEVPVLVRPRWHRDPEDRVDPDPQPWKHWALVDGRPSEALTDIAVLANMEELSKSLGKVARGAMSDAIVKCQHEVAADLPRGVEFEPGR